MLIHVRVCRVVADALQRERFHQVFEEVRRVVILDGTPKPLDLWARLVVDQMLITSEAAYCVDQHHGVIECSARLEAVGMSGAFCSAGPLSAGPGARHRSR